MKKPQYADADTKPWYRHFWLWFVILLPASVVVAALTTVYIASRGADDLVADAYYKEGLTINRRLEKQQRAAELGLTAQLAFEGVSVQVGLAAPGDPATLLLELSHPLEADQDFTARLSRIAPGYYAGRLRAAIAPRWHWSLMPDEQGEWRLDGVVADGDIADERDH
ncbi:MAG: FixH family protein [Halioglobus sp.]|nr:FixH family protein [Halioglobus sp.]